MGAEWNIAGGEAVQRASLHERFGGSSRTRLAPSAATRNIFVFVDAAREDTGRFEAGVLEVPGERGRGGQLGVNEALLHHRRDGRALRVFRRDGDSVVYIGEFVLDPRAPFSFAETAGPRGAQERSIVFRLVPVEAAAAAPIVPPAAAQHPFDRLRSRLAVGSAVDPWSALLLVSCLAVAVTTWGWTSAPVRPAVTTWFMLVCPGMALIRLRPPRGLLNRLVFAVAASLALETLVATAMLEAKAWSSGAALAVLLCVTLAAAAGRAPRPGWMRG